jgi:RNA polymerase sigma-70 factor (ECF subfamily)
LSDSILQRIAAGDSAAVKDCLDRYGPLVWSLARRFAPDTASAEDAAQEIFVALWKNARRFDPGVASETTFVATVARRRLIDRWRAAGRTPPVAPLDEAVELPGGGSRERVEAALDAARAARAIAQLPAEQRRVLELAVVDGKSHSEIARETGIALGTVKSHVRRGLLRVRELLGAKAPLAAGGSS